MKQFQAGKAIFGQLFVYNHNVDSILLVTFDSI